MAADSRTCSRGPRKFNQIRNSLSERRLLESVTVIVLVPAVLRPRLAMLFLESRGGTAGSAQQRWGRGLAEGPKPPGPGGEQAERTEGPGGREGAGRGPREGKRSSAKAGGQMAQERAEPRQQKVFMVAADSKGERGTGLQRGGEGRRGCPRSPDHSLPQSGVHAPTHTQPSTCATTHTQPSMHAPMHALPSAHPAQQACTHAHLTQHVCTHAHPVLHTPCPMRTHACTPLTAPGAVQELQQPSGPARRSQPDTRHVPAHAQGHACSYVLWLLTLSALINTSGKADGR